MKTIITLPIKKVLNFLQRLIDGETSSLSAVLFGLFIMILGFLILWIINPVELGLRP